MLILSNVKDDVGQEQSRQYEQLEVEDYGLRFRDMDPPVEQ